MVPVAQKGLIAAVFVGGDVKDETVGALTSESDLGAGRYDDLLLRIAQDFSSCLAD